jgi:hypothetical protein
MKYAGKNKSCNMRYVGKKLFLSIHFKNFFLEVYKMSPNIKTFEWTAAEAVQPHWSYPAYVEMPAPKAPSIGEKWRMERDNSSKPPCHHLHDVVRCYTTLAQQGVDFQYFDGTSMTNYPSFRKAIMDYKDKWLAIVHMIRASHSYRLWQFDPTEEVLDDVYEHLGEIIDMLLKGEAKEMYKPHKGKVSVHTFSVVIDELDQKYGHSITPLAKLVAVLQKLTTFVSGIF